MTPDQIHEEAEGIVYLQKYGQRTDLESIQAIESLVAWAAAKARVEALQVALKGAMKIDKSIEQMLWGIPEKEK